MKPIITSLLDTDLYKFSMLSAYFAKFSNVTAKFQFKDRKKQIEPTDELLAQINEQIDHVCTLQLTEEELEYLFSIRYFKNQLGFKEFMRNYKLNRDLITVGKDDNGLCIYTRPASILQTSMFEIYVLATVNELYCNNVLPRPSNIDLINTFIDNTETYANAPFKFVEFGTRRRYSKAMQQAVIQHLLRDHTKNGNFLGTSNVYFAKKYDLTPMGTFAHEFTMVGQGLKDVPVAQSQRYMFKAWLEHFEGDLGTCLTDTFNDEKFLKDFTRLYALTFNGLRHDSGDPIEWANKMIDMYKGYGIDPCSKTLFFSDGLNYKSALDIYEKLRYQAKVAFGIGTNLTNPICSTNIVMKPVEINGRKVAKLSNNIGKTMCEDSEYIQYLQEAIQRD